ncbi:hypothetical protein Ga0100231_005340 [Opitutaceae bacterium TAV4]|nr:hypothetical protein Ga0100231_005340 [Opitutaceae bacterium TAV4]RRK02587.1 hypothetical protein Ga0100230_005590 [Opitutaceae bacterium TAV3]
MGLLSGLFGGGDQKVDNGTHATDSSGNLQTGETGIVNSGSAKQNQSNTASDKAVSVSGTKNTVDQSLHVADNSGSVGAFKGNNNTLTVVTSTTDHGAVTGALEANERTTENALMANVLTTGMSLDTVDKTVALALGNARADHVDDMATVNAAIAAQRGTSADALQANVLTTGMSLDTVDKMASIMGGTMAETLRANTGLASDTLATSRAMLADSLTANSHVTDGAFDLVGDTTAQSLDLAERTLFDNNRVMLEVINSARAQSQDAQSTAQQINAASAAFAETTLDKYAENKSPSLAENKWLIGGVAAVALLTLLSTVTAASGKNK